MEIVIAFIATFGLSATPERGDEGVRIRTNGTFFEYMQAQNVRSIIEDDNVRPAEVPAVYVIVEVQDPPTK